jgi:hypothetical protein
MQPPEIGDGGGVPHDDECGGVPCTTDRGCGGEGTTDREECDVPGTTDREDDVCPTPTRLTECGTECTTDQDDECDVPGTTDRECPGVGTTDDDCHGRGTTDREYSPGHGRKTAGFSAEAVAQLREQIEARLADQP